MWTRAVAFLVAGLMLVSGGLTALPYWHATVSGGIVQCSGIWDPTAPRYAAGTVTVLKGQVTWKSAASPDLVPVLPTTVVATERVGPDSTYFFVLEPGRYVLQARYSAPIEVALFSEVTVQPGDDVSLDLGGCL
jgi:hypothetical protein